VKSIQDATFVWYGGQSFICHGHTNGEDCLLGTPVSGLSGQPVGAPRSTANRAFLPGIVRANFPTPFPKTFLIFVPGPRRDRPNPRERIQTFAVELLLPIHALPPHR
jgi:hypothetical protein